MNDYEFGNKIYELRKKCKISQEKLGELVGVSNKAVSKWEMGKAKPNVDVLKKLCDVFNVKLEYLLDNKNENINITKIVITGGPCAGKSTALSWIQNHFIKKGYKVLFINESATELINNGINYETCKSRLDFQKAIVGLQLEKEKIYMNAAKLMDGKILIVCDRGLLDSKAFINELEFQKICNDFNTNEIEMRDNYDAVFHLVSCAKGAEEFYTKDNNSARQENIDEARIVDDKIIAAWTGHPHFRIIDNSMSFEEKIKKLLKEIDSFLKEPIGYEIERKYLIEYPNIKLLESMDNCEKVEIIQTYLLSDNDEEVRVRQRGKNGNYIYYQTIKKNISNLKRIETEKRLSKEEYLNLFMNADPSCRQIRKTRYCITYGKTYYEIDIFKDNNKDALLEVELLTESDDVEIPPFVKVIKEVTNDESYKNHNIAKIKK